MKKLNILEASTLTKEEWNERWKEGVAELTESEQGRESWIADANGWTSVKIVRGESTKEEPKVRQKATMETFKNNVVKKIRDRLKILLFLIEPDFCPLDYEVVKKDFCMKRQEANKECNSFDCWEDLTSTLYLDETGVHAYEEGIEDQVEVNGKEACPACEGTGVMRVADSDRLMAAERCYECGVK